MNEFARKTDDILAYIADVLKPKSIDELAEAELDDSYKKHKKSQMDGLTFFW